MTLTDGSLGIYAGSTAGAVKVTSDYVSTSGVGAADIVTVATGKAAGDTVSVYSGAVITHGDSAFGIIALGYEGDYVEERVSGDLWLCQHRHSCFLRQGAGDD